ncbi:hypothetical protein E2C01_033379 [Portunus trituberculatus]|uniref:Uncharacterized protein n=1 Tax=Portunus trituberculatus TaxID=210409 RepID=A0A5B7EXQ3_PORTR|nr:hypothetical protein [Portunus trituberculatus]
MSEIIRHKGTHSLLSRHREGQSMYTIYYAVYIHEETSVGTFNFNHKTKFIHLHTGRPRDAVHEAVKGSLRYLGLVSTGAFWPVWAEWLPEPAEQGTYFETLRRRTSSALNEL